MLIGTFNREWLAHNALRNYPLSERATKQASVGGDFRLPDDLIVGAKLSIVARPDAVDINGFYLSRATLHARGANLVFGHLGTPIGVCSLIDTGERNITYPIYELGSFHGLIGHVTAGSFETARQWPGDYHFSLEGGRLDPDVVHYATPAMTSIAVIKSDGGRLNLTGDVRLVAGVGIDIQEERDSNDYLTLRIQKREVETETPWGVRTINGVGPDAGGNFKIESLTGCLSVEPIAHGLAINETCCEPCCGCSELEAISQHIADLNQANADIRIFQNNLQRALTSLTTSLNITGI